MRRNCAGKRRMKHSRGSSITIRSMRRDDCAVISQAFARQGWNKPTEQYLQYEQEAQKGRRDVLIAECGGEFAGYVTIVWESNYPPFREAGIPEIVDFNVLIKFRRKGIGTALMDAAEWRISHRSPTAGIGVGLTPDYGAAQVLYARRGYVPDGRGAMSHGQYITYGSSITVDDDLTICLTKKLDTFAFGGIFGDAGLSRDSAQPKKSGG